MFSRRVLVDLSLSFALIPLGSISLLGGSFLPNPLKNADASGVLETYSTTGGIDITSAFFQSLGTNGRTCNSCHISRSAWTLTPDDAK
ncbi:MAG TPA: hypothetical protein VFB00_07050, partial [Terriglobales bacterium]|nr:hypothetical protein [Terriglobales bacterium]